MLKIDRLTTKIKNLAIVSGSAVFMTLGINTSAMAAILYDLIDINPEDISVGYPVYNDIPTDINDAGQIVGYISVPETNRYNPGWLWSRENGRVWINDSSGQVDTIAIIPSGINNLGQVSVHRRSADYGSWTGIWSENGSVTPLERSYYFQSNAAYGINNLGQVVGSSNFSSEPIYNDIGELLDFEGKDHAVLWNSSTERIDIGTLIGRERSYATAINDSGQVVGYSNNNFSDNRAFFWNPETGVQDIGTLPGRDYSIASAINNQGQVLGFSGSNNGGSSFLWTQEAGIIPLPIRASDINDLGQVVGYCPGVWTEFCLWSPETGVTKLDISFDPTVDWKLEVLAGINNKGEIVGYGRKRNSIEPDVIRPFLLTPRNAEPVPEPITMGGTLLAGVGLAYLRRQRRLRSSQVTES
ncbi:PEP-CTERM sorting domain-containing protein [Nostoc sp. FACHB-87]|uniref:PEP-CTERM sorting domain-containing protein n=1 Tax=Nostocaceae TaxID=1162 RepID=UPI0016893A63|nr:MULTISPECIES: PEP-CTERM sorting domain-containing protein [Nostocaceae]MBD2298650.1 PEP-CTERM sorting domain-containing protein [Nostoc sp. FACHB-190]MBD2454420.1 PEP-CTERM sorting domain-containing protein [Nostoc sp. FACHB-87]MBD2474394.1 PEP-CTERM sorting domain-containing protein [Anabaena sp. FACHB-83]